MLLITYDISNDKVRTKFSKFLEQFGYRLQYSVFQIKNSKRILRNIIAEIEGKFSKKFTGADSILIFPISEVNEEKIIKYGYAKDMDDAILYL